MSVSSISRATSGSALVEMLVAVLIMSFASSAVLGILFLNNRAAQKLSDRSELVNAARTALERVGRDVRMGRSLGDCFGDEIILSTNSDGTQVKGVQGTNTFPSNKNPIYGNGQAPPQGWPAAPFPQPPYGLSSQTLVVQLPIFYSNANNANDPANGWPTMVPSGAGNPASAHPQDNVETHVYTILRDPDTVNHRNEWQLQMSAIPGYPVTAGTQKVYDPAAVNTQPRVLLKGIVGPLDSTGTPKLFQYMDRTQGPGGLPVDSPISGKTANFTGVTMNLEIVVHTESKSAQNLGFKTEVFVRNNSLATTTGQSSTVTGP